MSASAGSRTNVLIFSTDSRFFADLSSAYGDVCRRHRAYAAALRKVAGAQSSVRVIAYSGGRDDAGARRFDDGLEVYPAFASQRILYGIGLLRALPAVLRRWRPDVVTAQAPWGDAVLAFLLARLTGAAFVVQIHFDPYGANIAREIRGYRWRRHAANFLLRRADVIRTVNRSVAQRLVGNLGIPEERLHVIPVPINVDMLSADQEPAGETGSGERPTVLFVGRFSPAKNLPVWIDAAARIHVARPGTRFVLAGDGPEREKIVRLVEERGLQDAFEIPGNVPVDRLWKLYRSAAVFMLSSDNEGFGRVLIEAMWAGLPVVSTANAGASEIISDGSTGYLVPVGDAEGLAKRTVELLQNPVERHAMADRAGKAARQNFDPAKLADEIARMWARAGSTARNHKNADMR